MIFSIILLLIASSLVSSFQSQTPQGRRKICKIIVTNKIMTKYPYTFTVPNLIANSKEGNKLTVNFDDMKETPASSAEDKEIVILTFLLFLVTSLCALDRVAMSVAIIPMSSEFHYTEAVKGAISSTFSFGYMFGLIPAGILGSFTSPKYVLATGVLLWSLAQAASPIAAYTSLSALYAARFCMGFSEAVTTPTVQNFVATWIPEGRRALVLSIILSGFQIGNVFAYVVSPPLLEHFQWSGLFIGYGLIGLIWLALWLPIARDKPISLPTTTAAVTETASIATTLATKTAAITATPLAIASTTATAAAAAAVELDIESPKSKLSMFDEITQTPWKQILQCREVQAIAVAHSVQNFGLYINLAWLPTYFNQKYGLSVVDSSLSSVLPWVAGGIVGPLTGYVADTLVQRGVDKTLVRRGAQSVALVVPAATLLKLSVTDNLTSFDAMLYFVLAVAAAACNSAGFSASVQDICKSPKYISLVYGATSAPAVLMGSLGCYVTGVALDYTHSWSVVFQGTALVYLVGAAFYATNYSAKKIFD